MPPTAPTGNAVELSTDELASALGGSISTATAVSEVTRRMLDYFTSGTINVGDRLPPERQLATSMGVGRSAIREALAALEILGVVDVRPGSGTYLRGTVSELLPQTLSWGMLLGAPKSHELVQVRHALEVQAARTAASVIDDAALEQLVRDLADMEAAQADFTSFVAADLRFHQGIAVAANNTLLNDMLHSVRSLLRVWVDRALNDAKDARKACREHATILAALQRRQPTAAAEAMSRHMDTAGRRLIEAIDAVPADTRRS